MKKNETLQVGKISPELLEEIVFNRLGYSRKEVILTPAVGEDTAALDVGEELLLVSTDPITGAEDRAGWLAVKVAVNDIAAAGGEPICILVTLLLPEDSHLSDLKMMMSDINRACIEEKVQVAGGHTEVTQGLRQPIISITALGKTKNRRMLNSSNAKVGDDIVMTKWAGMEGTSILVGDFKEIFGEILDKTSIRQAESLFSLISVTRDGRVAAEARANACHDATEGGILGAIYEICQASGLGATVYADRIPVLPVTLKVAEFCKIDPLSLISSGSLVVTTPDGHGLCQTYLDAGIKATLIGKISSEERVMVRRGERRILNPPGPDHLWQARRFLENMN